jgi:diguanylate cyclase (GGDEF)-like protein
MRLLLVDDDELDRMAVVRVLQNPKLVKDIVHANTAVRALKLYNEGTFDVVLLDYRLPDMECLEVLNQLTQHTDKHAAVVILTGMDDNEVIERMCIFAGAQDFLLKKELSERHLTKALMHAQARHALNNKLIDTHRRLKYLAENDPMTGLSNRYYFEEHLQGAIQRAHRLNFQLGLIYLDIDNFKLINDSLGHDSGDQLLQQIAQRLLLVVREGDVVCRLGGDEFAIIVHDLETETSVGALAQRIIENLREPIVINNTEHFVTCSIGIATYPRCALTAEDMQKHADLAMYQVKREGRNGFHFFSESLQDQILHRIMLEGELRSQRLQNQLVQYYQPVINAKNFQVCGAEMLMRWNHPSMGLLPPSEFVEIVEELGFLADIDTKNRQLACKQLAQWRKEGLVGDDFVLAVNASEQLLRQENMHNDIKSDLEAAGLPGQCLSIEVTESVLVSDFDKTSALLNRIIALSVKIAIDDFGTGYSSMAYLKWLPASILKVDRSFVQNVPESEADCRVLKAIIIMAKSLDLDVIVEGVETIEQARLCREFGADKLQGYLFSKPLSPDDFAKFLNQHNSHSYLPKPLKTNLKTSGAEHWFPKIIGLAGNSFSTSTFIVENLGDIESISEIELLHNLEDFLNKINTDIIKVTNILYKQFLLLDTTKLDFPEDFYTKFSSALNLLVSHGFIILHTDSNAIKPITVTLVDPTYIIVMCVFFADHNSMQELVDIVERCHIDLCLKASQLKVIFNLPIHVVKSVFEIFDSEGFGSFSKTKDDFNYIGKV